MPIKPPYKPQAKRSKVESLARKWSRYRLDIGDYDCYMLAVRGYYRHTMGKPGVNDRGIYDDAIIIVTPTSYSTFNANCDPGAHRKGIANLKVGTHFYKPGTHGISKPKHLQYRAFRQAEKVTVVRDGIGEDFGLFGINIHRGGYRSVSSAGCLTVYPTQWAGFRELMYSELKRYEQKKFPVILIENKGQF